MEQIVTSNALYNEINCSNCWYIITVLDPDKTYVCPKCGKNGDKLVEYKEKYKKLYHTL